MQVVKGFLSTLFSTITQKNTTILEAKNAEEVENNLRGNRQFTISAVVAEIECLKFSRNYINALFNAIKRSPDLRKLVFEAIKSTNYRTADWKLVIERTLQCDNIKVIELVLEFSRETSFEIAKLLEKTKSVTTLQLRFPYNTTNREVPDYQIISDGFLKNSSIVEFKITDPYFVWQKDRDAIVLIDALSKKRITRLELNIVHQDLMKAIFERVHASSIEELVIQDQIPNCLSDLQPLGELIAKNGSIRKLSICATRINDRNFGELVDPIKKSKTLKMLVLNNEQLSDEGLAEIIEHSKSLNSVMSVNFGRTVETDLELLAAALKKNSNLTRLDIQSRHITSQGYINLGEALKVNTALKKLFLSHNDRVNNADVAPLFEGLKFNTSLNTLAITRHISGVGYHMNEVLKTNRALINVIPKEHENDNKPHPQLFLNRINQDKVVLGGKSLVNTIRWHLESFLAICPLEIWYNILAHVTCPGVGINFPRALQELLKNNRGRVGHKSASND